MGSVVFFFRLLEFKQSKPWHRERGGKGGGKGETLEGPQNEMCAERSLHAQRSLSSLESPDVVLVMLQELLHFSRLWSLALALSRYHA